jgi:hypothetical protein
MTAIEDTPTGKMRLIIELDLFLETTPPCP